MSIMQRLYDSEINAVVYSFYDNGFRVYLGDEMNGYRADTTVQTWDEVERWLDRQARIHFPDSAYARNS